MFIGAALIFKLNPAEQTRRAVLRQSGVFQAESYASVFFSVSSFEERARRGCFRIHRVSIRGLVHL
jgi:hypothetical protein